MTNSHQPDNRPPAEMILMDFIQRLARTLVEFDRTALEDRTAGWLFLHLTSGVRSATSQDSSSPFSGGSRSADNDP